MGFVRLLPQSITLSLGGLYLIDTVKYLPRQDGNSNGNTTSYKVYASSDGLAIMNDIFVQQLYMPKQSLVTMATALTTFVSQRNSDLGALCAEVMIVILPSVIF